MKKHLLLLALPVLLLGCEKNVPDPEEPKVSEYEITYKVEVIHGTFSVKFLDESGEIVELNNLGSDRVADMGEGQEWEYTFKTVPGKRVYLWARHDGNAAGPESFNTVGLWVSGTAKIGQTIESGTLYANGAMNIENSIDEVLPEQWTPYGSTE